MSDVVAALAVFTGVVVATADFLAALAVNAVKWECRKRTMMREKEREGEKTESSLQHA